MKKITVLILLLVSVIGLSQPTTLPAIPTRLQANVISIYSDSYTTCATNLNPNWGQSGGVNATFNPLGTGTNVVMAYTNFNYQGTDLTTQNASNMEYLHVDVWSNASPVTSILKVSPVNNGAGATGPAEVLVTINFTTGVWTSVDIPKSAFTGMTWNAVNQIKFAANGPGSIVPITIYLDNIYFWKQPMPATAAPTPTSVAANVISLFSNSYPNVGVDTWLTPWSAGNTSTLQIAGNDTRSYTNLNFVGIETTGANLINASCMSHFNIDIWTPNMTQFKIKLVDWGANGVYQGTPNDDTEAELTFTPTLNGWNTYNIPLSNFTSAGLLNRSKIAQMIFSGSPVGSGIAYIDNVFYSRPVGSTTPSVLVSNGAVCIGQSYTISPTGAINFVYSGGNAVVSPTANSTYTVTGTNSIVGCSSTATMNVIVNPLPTITVNSGTICAGQTFTINPAGANSYSIQGGSAVVTPTASANFIVIGTNTTTGCSSTNTSSLTVNAKPVITIAGTQTICSGETANITASGANTYTWSNAANTNSISVSPSVTTQYSVAGTNTLGCSNTLTLSVDVQLCTNLNNTNQEFSTINLFPNPNNGQFTINISDEENTQINITNVLGQIILSQKGESITKIDLSKFENGMYFIKVINTNNKTIFNKGIIKQ